MAKNWFTVKQLFPNIWAIAEFGHFEKVISYLFIGRKQALLFDTGMGIGNILQEVCLLTKLPVVVLNSHCHPDHIGGNKHFTKVLQLNSQWGREVAASGYKNADLATFIDSQRFLIAPPEDFKSDLYTISSLSISKYVRNGTKISIDPFIFTVITTPGHTPDGLCLYEETARLLLTGDTIYPGPIYLFFKESNYKDYKRSIEKLSAMKDIRYLLPAHNDFLQKPSIIQKINEKMSLLKEIKHYPKNIDIDNNTQIIFTNLQTF